MRRTQRFVALVTQAASVRRFFRESATEGRREACFRRKRCLFAYGLESPACVNYDERAMTKVRSSSGERFDSATFAAEIIRGAVWKGLEPAPLLDLFGLHSYERLAIGDRVPLSAMFAAWEYVMKHLREPGFPVEIGLRSSTRLSSPLAHLYQSLGTLRDALAVHARLRQIISPYGWKLQREDGGSLTVVLDGLDDLGLGARCHREYFVARTFGVLKAMEADVYPEVSFSHAMPDDVGAHLLAFPGGLAWQQSETTLRASSASLDKVFAAPAPGSLAALERIIEQLRARLGPPPLFSSRAAEQVARQLRAGVRPTVERVAAALGITERTLQRRLKEEQTTCEDIFDDVRRAYAIEQLPKTSRKELAAALGFESAAALRRALRRWKLASP